MSGFIEPDSVIRESLRENPYMYPTIMTDWNTDIKQSLTTGDLYRDAFNQYKIPNTEVAYATQYAKSANRVGLDELYKKYSMKIDYIDMVHDITSCIGYFKDVLPRNTYADIENLITKLCTTNSNIRVPRSHELQSEYLQNYINELRVIGFMLPDIEEPVSITPENIKETLRDYLSSTNPVHCARESGRGFNNYIESILDTKENDNTIREVHQNMLGQMDGCVGTCEVFRKTETPVKWSCDVAGIIHVTITSFPDSTHQIVVHIDNGPAPLVFTVRGRVILNDVLAHLYGANATFRGMTYVIENRINQITLPDGFSKTNPYHCLALISLKTVCDKRIQQRIQTDRALEKGPIQLITTVDKYVFAGTVLAYLGQRIQYCPAVLLQTSDGYTKYQFGNIRTNPDELLHRYRFYIYYRDPRRETPLKTTFKYIKMMKRIAENPETIYDNFWDFIRTNAIACSKENFQRKHDILNEKLSAVDKAIQNRNIPEIQNTLLRIPTVPPTINDLFTAFDDESDTTDIWNDNFDIGSISNALLNVRAPSGKDKPHRTAYTLNVGSPDAISESEIREGHHSLGPHEEKSSKNSQRLFDSNQVATVIESIRKSDGTLDMPKTRELITKYKLVLNYVDTYLPKYNARTNNIDVDADHIKITYSDRLKKAVNMEDDVQIIGNMVILPSKAQLLIHLAENIVFDRNVSLEVQHSMLTKIGNALYARVAGWFTKDFSLYEKPEEFVRLFLNSIKNPTYKTYNKIIQLLPPQSPLQPQSPSLSQSLPLPRPIPPPRPIPLPRSLQQPQSLQQPRSGKRLLQNISNQGFADSEVPQLKIAKNAGGRCFTRGRTRISRKYCQVIRAHSKKQCRKQYRKQYERNTRKLPRRSR